MSVSIYTPEEMMTVVLARDLVEGEVGMVGATSDIPVAACLLAQKLHAPSLTFLTPSGFINPKPRYLHRSSSDGRYYEGCEALTTGYELFENSENGRLDFMFYGGIQIDKYGNTNLNFIGGDFKHPKFWGPGLANISFAVTAKRFYLFPTTHTKRNLVEKVDYVSAPGFLDGYDSRRRAGITTAGPKLCVSPLAVLDFEETSHAMRLVSLHEGVTVEQVIENTGFELIVPKTVSTTPPPTEEELTILRQEVDPLGLLRK